MASCWQEMAAAAGFRLDGRRPHECRRLECTLGILHRAVDGSAMFQAGQTRVMASVAGPHEAERWVRDASEMHVDRYLGRIPSR
jgi:ribonuclease PH